MGEVHPRSPGVDASALGALLLTARAGLTKPVASLIAAIATEARGDAEA